jgi:hypothetical protein
VRSVTFKASCTRDMASPPDILMLVDLKYGEQIDRCQYVSDR